MFRIVQLSHDILTDRVLVGIQGPGPSDYISLGFALPDRQGQPVRELQAVAVAEAGRLLAEAAQALHGGRPDDPAGRGAPAGGRARFTCECCGEIAAGPVAAQPEPPPETGG